MHGPALFAPLGVALRGHANRISMSIAILREAWRRLWEKIAAEDHRQMVAR